MVDVFEQGSQHDPDRQTPSLIAQEVDMATQNPPLHSFAPTPITTEPANHSTPQVLPNPTTVLVDEFVSNAAPAVHALNQPEDVTKPEVRTVSFWNYGEDYNTYNINHSVSIHFSLKI